MIGKPARQISNVGEGMFITDAEITSILNQFRSGGKGNPQFPQKFNDVESRARIQKYMKEQELVGLITFVDVDMDGNKEGSEQWYYPDGSLGGEMTFKSDKKDGSKKSYYPDGTLRSETHYKADMQEGPEKWYYPDSTLQLEINHKADVQDGSEKWYYPDSTIKSEATYKAGKLDGFVKKYCEDGLLQEVKLYEDDIHNIKVSNALNSHLKIVNFADSVRFMFVRDHKTLEERNTAKLAAIQKRSTSTLGL